MKELVPVAMLLIGRRRPRENPKGHFQSKDHTPSIPLRVTFSHYGGDVSLRQFRSKGLFRADIAHAHTIPLGRYCATYKGTPKGSRDLRSFPVALVLVLLLW